MNLRSGLIAILAVAFAGAGCTESARQSTTKPAGAAQGSRVAEETARDQKIARILETDQFLPVAAYNLTVLQEVADALQLSSEEEKAFSAPSDESPDSMTRSHMVAKLGKLPTRAQAKLASIAIQVHPVEALCGRGLRNHLQLNRDQRRRLDRVASSVTAAEEKVFKQWVKEKRDPSWLTAERDQILKTALAKCLTILRPDQRAEFEALKGEPVKLADAHMFLSPLFNEDGLAAFKKALS